MPAISPEEHRREYAHYDRRVDIVSVAEVWFTKSEGLAGTVRHFERYPEFMHEDGEPVTPDFTVLFTDDTALVGELSDLALNQESLDKLCAQIGRYAALTEVPSGPRDAHRHQPLQPVTAVDVVVLMKHDVANGGIDRIRRAMEDDGHPYDPPHPPTVLAWSYDPDTGDYTFSFADREGNVRPRSHGRDPSIGAWLADPRNNDTLKGKPRHFVPVKAEGQFMNDGPPQLYTATVLWAKTLPALLAEVGETAPAEFDTDAATLAGRLRDDYGFGRAVDVKKALELLRFVGLAKQTDDGWRILYRDLSRSDENLPDALLSRYRTAQERAKRRRAGPRQPPSQKTLETSEQSE